MTNRQRCKEGTNDEFVKNHKRPDVRDLRGKVKIRANYDYKKLRR
jgi:hypothetical protein